VLRNSKQAIIFDSSIKRNAMKTIEFKNTEGNLVEWGMFSSMAAAKRGLSYVKKMFSKEARIINL